jgi:hydrogenase/urease accessory protein HupE
MCIAAPPLLRLWLGLFLLGVATRAHGHPAPFSYVDVFLDAQRTRGTLVVHDFDVAHELGIARPESLRDPELARGSRAALLALLEARLRLRADAVAVRVLWGDIEVLAQRQSVRLSFELERPVRGRLDIEAALFPYDASHQTFVNLYERGVLEQQAILDARNQTLTFYAGSVSGRLAVVSTFLRSGVQHILIGPDHVLFLLGLLLLGGSWWRLAAIVTAFTVGHSITLSLAALGWVQLSPRIVEPAIALSIIVVGVDNLLVKRQQQAGAANAARDVRPWLAGAFGLIHGFGFAAVLIELGLPREALAWSLAAFNAGVEAGQLCLVLAAIGLGQVALRLPLLRAQAERFLTLASVAVIVAGIYWLVLRLGFTSML